jgi:hypothetical protein
VEQSSEKSIWTWKKEEERGVWTKLHNYKLHNYRSLPDKDRKIKKDAKSREKIDAYNIPVK